MANYKRRTRKRNRSKSFVALPVDGAVGLGTLANNTVIKSNIHTGIFQEDFYAISADMQVDVNGLTPGEGSPMSWGLSHSDYSTTEVEENLAVSLLGRGSKIEQERLKRLVRNGGLMDADGVIANTRLTEPKGQVRVPLRFMIQEGFALECWIKNRSGSALTTGATFSFAGVIYGRWVT